MDELMRALFGLIWAWPGLWACRRLGAGALATAALVTAWMMPGWWIYQRLAGG